MGTEIDRETVAQDDDTCRLSEYGHTWVGGMNYVHREDAETVNAMRLDNGLDPLECERCEYRFGSVK